MRGLNGGFLDNPYFLIGFLSTIPLDRSFFLKMAYYITVSTCCGNPK